MRTLGQSTHGRHLAFFAIAAGLMTACTAKTDPNPLGEIILTGQKGAVTKVVGSNHTMAFGVDDLAPVSFDPAGTKDSLSFVPATPTASYRQEVIAFDLDLSSPILAPDPLVDFAPVKFNSFSVPANTKRSYTFPDETTTAQIIRYWHGLCAARSNWQDIFTSISNGMLDQISTAAKAVPGVTSATRDSDTFQVMLNSEKTDIRHGFYFEAQYHVNIGPITWNSFTVNPAYTITARPSDGLVSVTNIHTAVIPLDSNTQPVEDALKNTLGVSVEQGIAKNMTIPLAGTPFPLTCVPTNEPAKEMARCFGLVAGGGTGSVAFALFNSALLKAGKAAPDANALATSMVAGLAKENFSCPAPSAGATATCAFHPIVKRANVLPDALELVFASDIPATQLEMDEQTLYLNLPAVAEFLKPGAGASANFCNQPVEIQNNPTPVPVFFHDTATE